MKETEAPDKVPIQITQNTTLGKSENALVGLHSDFKHFFDGHVGFFSIGTIYIAQTHGWVVSLSFALLCFELPVK